MELDKVHIMFGSDLDDLSLGTAPAADANFPETNMQKSGRGSFFRTTSTTSVITASVGGADVFRYANGAIVARHNLENDATVRWRLFDDIDQTGNVVYDSSALSANNIIPWGVWIPGKDVYGASYEDLVDLPKTFANWFEGVAYRSVRIDISAPSNTTIDIGQLFLKDAFVPKFNFSHGSEFELVDPSNLTRTAAGGYKGERLEPWRRFTFSLDWLDDADQERLSREIQKAGKTKDVFVSRHPGAEGLTKLNHMMVAKRVSNSKFNFNRANNQTQQMIFEET